MDRTTRAVTLADLEDAVEVLRSHPSTSHASYESAVQLVAGLREAMSDTGGDSLRSRFREEIEARFGIESEHIREAMEAFDAAADHPAPDSEADGE